MVRVVLLSLLLVAIPQSRAWGALITFYYGGVLDSRAVSPALDVPFEVGDVFSGSYTFESTISDTDGDSGIGDYALSSATLEVGGTMYSVTADSIVVQSDSYDVSGRFPEIPLFGTSPRWYIFLRSTSDTFGTDALPLTPPDLDLFSVADFAIEGVVPFFGSAEVEGPLSYLSATDPSLVPVPTPPAYLMMLSGLGLLTLDGWHRRRRRL